MSKHIYAYIAGIIDGEGTIGIRKFNNSTGQLHYRPMIEVSMTDKKVIDLLCKLFGNSSCFHHKPDGVNKLVYTWRVTGKKCLPVLDAVGHYLIVKEKQAKLCHKFVDRIGRRGIHWSDDFRTSETKIRHKLYLKSRVLNKRGV